MIIYKSTADCLGSRTAQICFNLVWGLPLLSQECFRLFWWDNSLYDWLCTWIDILFDPDAKNSKLLTRVWNCKNEIIHQYHDDRAMIGGNLRFKYLQISSKDSEGSKTYETALASVYFFHDCDLPSHFYSRWFYPFITWNRSPDFHHHPYHMSSWACQTTQTWVPDGPVDQAASSLAEISSVMKANFSRITLRQNPGQYLAKTKVNNAKHFWKLGWWWWWWWWWWW